MTDIVERLRVFAFGKPHMRSPRLLCEAADEIERLRAELATFKTANLSRAGNHPGNLPYEGAASSMASEADKADRYQALQQRDVPVRATRPVGE